MAEQYMNEAAEICFAGSNDTRTRRAATEFELDQADKIECLEHVNAELVEAMGKLLKESEFLFLRVEKGDIRPTGEYATDAANAAHAALAKAKEQA